MVCRVGGCIRQQFETGTNLGGAGSKNAHNKYRENNATTDRYCHLPLFAHLPSRKQSNESIHSVMCDRAGHTMRQTNQGSTDPIRSLRAATGQAMRNKSLHHGRPRCLLDPVLQSCPPLEETEHAGQDTTDDWNCHGTARAHEDGSTRQMTRYGIRVMPCSKHLSVSNNGHKIKASLGPWASTPKLTTHRGLHALRHGALSSMR